MLFLQEKPEGLYTVLEWGGPDVQHYLKDSWSKLTMADIKNAFRQMVQVCICRRVSLAAEP